MNPTLLSISVDLLLIFRISIAFCWGFLYAAFLQFHRQGQFLVERRTWITVVLGIGIDLLIAYPGDWSTVALVISISSIGIIVRSLWNESTGANPNPTSYKLKHHLEDITALAETVISQLTQILKSNHMDGKTTADISQVLSKAHSIQDHAIDARNGR